MKKIDKNSFSSLLTIIISSLTINTGTLFAQVVSERYPNNAEIQQLRKNLNTFIQLTQNDPTGSNYIRDRRTASQKREIQSFVNGWSKVDSVVAPFLGTWSGYERGVSIYPTRVKGEVCLIITREGMGQFLKGTVTNSVLRTKKHTIFIKSGNYLGEAIVEKNQSQLIGNVPFSNQEPLLSAPKRVEGYVIEAFERKTIIQGFNSNGCTASFPNK